MGNDAGWWWLPGVLIGSVGVLAFVGGLAAGGPDAVSGAVFGGAAMAAATVILWRRAPTSGGPG